MSQQLTAGEVKELAKRAAPEKWRSVPWHICEGAAQVRASDPDDTDYLLCEVPSDGIAAFIAAAPAMAHLIETQAAELAAKDARIAALEKNDARYRYIRERICLTCVTAEPDPQDLADEYPEQVDEFIDAALAPSRAALKEKGE